MIRRVIMLVTVALVMVVIMVTMAMAAFAQSTPNCREGQFRASLNSVERAQEAAADQDPDRVGREVDKSIKHLGKVVACE